MLEGKLQEECVKSLMWIWKLRIVRWLYKRKGRCSYELILDRDWWVFRIIDTLEEFGVNKSVKVETSECVVLKSRFIVRLMWKVIKKKCDIVGAMQLTLIYKCSMGCNSRTSCRMLAVETDFLIMIFGEWILMTKISEYCLEGEAVKKKMKIGVLRCKRHINKWMCIPWVRY